MLAADFGEMGMMTLQQPNADVWQTVQMSRDYIDPVVIAGPLSINGSDPAMVRVRNVDAEADTFEVQIDEWIYLDGYHTAEMFSYIVVEAGRHVLEDGTLLEAGTKQMNLDIGANQEWFEQEFSSAFTDAPVVFSQLASANGPDPAVVQQRDISSGKVFFKLREEEKRDNWHVQETVSWLAIEAGPGVNGTTNFLVGRTGDVVTHQWHTLNFGNDSGGNPNFGSAPSLLAQMQTTDGADTANVRYRNLSGSSVQLQVDEEQSKDKEVKHTAEDVGFLAFGGTGLVYGLDNSRPTVISPIANVTIVEDGATQTIDIGAAFDDADIVSYGDLLTFDVHHQSQLLRTTLENGILSIDPLGGQNGTATLIVTATDSRGEAVADTFTVTITPVAQPVGISGPRETRQDNEFTLQLDAGETGATDWTIDWGDGSTPQVVSNVTEVTHTYASAGPFTINAVSSDATETYTANQHDVLVRHPLGADLLAGLNGSFELAPLLARGDIPWDIFDDDEVPGWSVVRDPNASQTDPSPRIELQRDGLAGMPQAADGRQWIELGADENGPQNLWGTAPHRQQITGRAEDGRLAIISDELETIIGDEYELRFAFAGRPGTSAAINRMSVAVIDSTTGQSVDIVILDDAGEKVAGPIQRAGSTNWRYYTALVKAPSARLQLKFAAEGTHPTQGALLDDVQFVAKTKVVPRVRIHDASVCENEERISHRIVLSEPADRDIEVHFRYVQLDKDNPASFRLGKLENKQSSITIKKGEVVGNIELTFTKNENNAAKRYYYRIQLLPDEADKHEYQIGVDSALGIINETHELANAVVVKTVDVEIDGMPAKVDKVYWVRSTDCQEIYLGLMHHDSDLDWVFLEDTTTDEMEDEISLHGGRIVLTALHNAADFYKTPVTNAELESIIDGARSPFSVEKYDDIRRVGLFFDGTSNHLESQTNVVHLYNVYDSDKFYYGGVGNKIEYQTGLDAVQQQTRDWLENFYNGEAYKDLTQGDRDALIEHFVDLMKDSPEGTQVLGGALGVGWGQVMDRAFADLVYLDSSDANHTFQVDVFGFSRGAAMANEFARLVENSALADRVDIRFMGLFDPVYSQVLPGQDSAYVSSEGWSWFSEHNSRKDNYVVGLTPKKVEDIVILYAEHEERVWFPATDLRLPKGVVAGTDEGQVDLDKYAFIGTHSDVGGHWQTNPRTQNIAFWAMAHNAVIDGVPIDLDKVGLDPELARAYTVSEVNRYLPAWVESQLGDGQLENLELWTLMRAEATWQIWSDAKIEVESNQLDDASWALGPWGTTQSRGHWTSLLDADINAAKLLDVFDGLRVPFVDGQPIKAHVPRNLFFVDATFDTVLESLDEVFEALDPERADPEDITINPAVWAKFANKRAAGKETGKGWLADD